MVVDETYNRQQKTDVNARRAAALSIINMWLSVSRKKILREIGREASVPCFPSDM
jgi:hypothetical protein